jgi:membrane-bound lytic murein transglycosylase D
MIIRAARRLLPSGALLAILSLSAGCGLQSTRPGILESGEEGWGPGSSFTLADGTPVRQSRDFSDDGTRLRARSPTPRASQGGPKDVWSRVRGGFQLGGITHPTIATEVDWFARNQGFLDRTSERARPYLFHIIEEVEARGMPSELALLPIIESAFQPFAYSPARAAGIWQFIPETGRRFGLKQTWWYDGRRDVVASTDAALRYLETLHDQFAGDWLLAVAAYNCGEGNVGRAIQENERRGLPTDFWNLALPEETRGYVPRLLAMARIVAEPGAHGVRLPTIANEPAITRVAVGGPIDLEVAAEVAGLRLSDVRHLNPGHSRWATDPDGPHHLVLPVDRAETFLARLESMPQAERTPWKRHVVRPGETLPTIASRYGTDSATLQQVNELVTSRVRPGHVLRVPLTAGGTSVVLAEASPAASLSEPAADASTGRKGSRQASRPSPPKAVSHTVARGETLSGVARRHGVSVADLAGWNKLRPGASVKVGQKLTVKTGRTEAPEPVRVAARTAPPSGAVGPNPSRGSGTSPNARPDRPKPADAKASATPAKAVAGASGTRDATGRMIRYRVKSGETLWAISQRFGVSVDMLRRWNKLGGKQDVRAGQELNVVSDGLRTARTG